MDGDIDDKRIPRAELDVAHARLCRRIAAAIITAMAESNMGVDDIAKRLRKKPDLIKGRLDRLIAGRSITLSQISDILFAMGAELAWRLKPRDEAEVH